jgi:hypothetical protein
MSAVGVVRVGRRQTGRSTIEGQGIRMNRGLMGMGLGKEEIHGRMVRNKDKVKVMGKDKGQGHRVKALDLG